MVEHQSAALDRVFHALSDPTRRSMLADLALNERTVGELAAPFRISLAASSKHIRVLEEAGLVHRTVQGRQHVCRLAPDRLAEAHEWLGFYQRFWGQRLDALAALLPKRKKD